MTDIVERLRDGPVSIRYCMEAADEIERLRAAGRDLLYAIGHDREDMINDAAERMRRALEQKP